MEHFVLKLNSRVPHLPAIFNVYYYTVFNLCLNNKVQSQVTKYYFAASLLYIISSIYTFGIPQEIQGESVRVRVDTVKHCPQNEPQVFHQV